MSFINHVIARTFNALSSRLNTIAPTILATRRYVLYAGSVASAGYLFQHFFYDHSTASGPSMYPTMPADGLVVIHEQLSKREVANSTKGDPDKRKLKVGDIIRFTSPIFENVLAGKRIVGMPGDYVVRDPRDSPTVGGASVPGITDFRTDAEIEKDIPLKEREEPIMIQVPEGHVWVAGDNLAWSRDSRFYGPVPMALILGVTKAGLEGVFTWKTYGGAMEKVPKEHEEWVLEGRPARVIDSMSDVSRASLNKSAPE